MSTKKVKVSFLKIFIIFLFLGAKKVIDVGVFTGASSLAAALALPEVDT